MWLQLFINGLIAGSTYGLIALGFSVIYGVARFFHFSHAAIVTVGAYSTYYSISFLDLSLAAGIGFGIISAAMTGIFIEVLIYKPMRLKSATKIGLLLSSLGIYIVIQNVVSLIFGDNVLTLPHRETSDPIFFFGSTFTVVQAIIFIVNSLLYFCVYLLLMRTRLGISIRAVASEPLLASIKGIRTNAVYIKVMIIGSSLAGIAGIMSALDTNLAPTMGFRLLLMGVVGAMVGGVGRVGGAFLGGLFIGLVQHLSAGIFPTQWQDAIVFAILILFLFFRPSGMSTVSAGRTEYD